MSQTIKVIPEAVKLFDDYPNSAFIRPQIAKILIGVSIATFWRLAKSGQIKTHKLTERTTTVKVSDLTRFHGCKGRCLIIANNKTPKNKGLATQTTNPDTTKRKIKFTDNSAQNQRLKLLDWLLEKNSITTTQARTNLDIMSPAARILELKRHGYLINTVPAEWVSEHGINHKGVARYVLTQKQPIEAVNQCEVA